MTKGVDNQQDTGSGQLNGVDFGSFTTTLQAIFTEGADYTKKSVESRLALGEKLLGAKSFETVIQIQSEYAKSAYADFVAQATKMGELHSNLAKAQPPRADPNKAYFVPCMAAITCAAGLMHAERLPIKWTV